MLFLIKIDLKFLIADFDEESIQESVKIFHKGIKWVLVQDMALT